MEGEGVSFGKMLGRKRVYAFKVAPAAKRARFRGTTAAKRYRINQRLSARGPSARGTLRQQVKSLQTAVKRTLPEMKYVDVDNSSTNIGDPGVVTHVTAIAQGDSISTRTGDSVRVKSLTATGRFVVPIGSAGAAAATCYRLALVLDKQTIADTVPGLTDIFTPSRPETAMPNLTNLGRFKMLWLSKIFYPNMMVVDTEVSAAATSVPTQGFCFDFNWIGDVVVRYNGSAATDFQKNAIFAVVLSSDTTDTIDVDWTTRVGFTDG